MKKIIVLGLLILFSFKANSQDLSIFLQGGGNYSNLLIKTPDTWESLDNTIGFNAGLGFNVVLNDKLEVESGIIYSAIGADNLRSKYLYFPLMISPIRVNNFSLQTGFQFGYLLNQDSSIGDLSKDYDVAVGIGFKQLVTDNIGIGVRYSITINDIQANDNGTTDLKNSFWNVYGLYYFNF